MPAEISLFISLFVTLLAIINPLEALPVYLGLVDGKPEVEQRRVAQRACFYALLLSFFFLFFGTLLLRVFDMPLSMVRVVGGVILTRVGFELFNPSPSGGMVSRNDSGNSDVAFVPLAMPIMFVPGAIATVISMASTVKQSAQELLHFAAAAAAILACMAVTYLSLLYSRRIVLKIGPAGIARRPASSASSLPRWAWG